jgi:phage/plasmid-associated DNA primase
MPALLKWLVDGAVQWYKDNAAKTSLRKNAPAKVKEFSRAYLEEQDCLQVFISDKCIIDPNAKTITADFLYAFNTWSEDVKYNSKTLVAAMKRKGFEKKSLRVDGEIERCFAGIRFKDRAPVLLN